MLCIVCGAFNGIIVRSLIIYSRWYILYVVYLAYNGIIVHGLAIKVHSTSHALHYNYIMHLVAS